LREEADEKRREIERKLKEKEDSPIHGDYLKRFTDVQGTQLHNI